MNNEENKVIEEVEQELKYRIITLEDEIKDSKAKKYLDSIVKELNVKLETFKKLIADTKDSEKVAELKNQFLNEVDNLVVKSKKVIDDIKNNEDLRQKIEDGTETVVSAAKKVANVVEDGVNDILTNPTVAKTIDNISDKVVDFLNDDKVQENVKKAKKGVLNVASNAFEGLKKVLKADELNDDDNNQIENDIL